LQGARYYLGRRGRVLVDEHHHAPSLEAAPALGAVVHAWRGAPLGVDDEVALGQELARHVDGGLQVSPAVVLQVEHEALHALPLKPGHGLEQLGVGGGAEAAYAHVAHAGAYDVCRVDGLDGYLVACDGEREPLAHAPAHHAEAHLGALGPAQAAHYLAAGHAHAGYGGVVDGDYAVAGEYAHALRGASADGLYHHERVFNHVELHADALEVARQRLGEGLHLLGRGIRRMRVELGYHAAYAVLDELLLVHAVNVEGVDGHLGNVELAQGAVVAYVYAHLGRGGPGQQQRHGCNKK